MFFNRNNKITDFVFSYSYDPPSYDFCDMKTQIQIKMIGNQSINHFIGLTTFLPYTTNIR